MTKPRTAMFLGEEVPIIYSYTRAQAIEDGELVDLTEWAKEVGFKYPVALTRNLWASIEDIPKRLEGIADVRGRAHDVLWMASLAARRTGGEWIEFRVILPRTPTDSGSDEYTRRQEEELMANCGPGDDAEPVVTIGYAGDF